MGRGPGRWQRAVLEACEGGGWVTTDDVLSKCGVGAHPTTAARDALRRAMHRLADEGVVELDYALVAKQRHLGGLHFDQIRPGGIKGRAERWTLRARRVQP